jgi:hypothetical protein
MRLLATLLLVTTLLPASTVLFDGTFTPGNYALSTYNPAGATVGFSQSAAGGNPGSAIDITISYTAAFNVRAGLISSTLTYNPSVQGAITTIDASGDLYLDLGQFNGVTNNGRLVWMIEQGGSYYRALGSIASLAPTTFQSFSSPGLTAASFGQVDFATNTVNGAANPDFSATGGLIRFGLTATFAPSVVTAPGTVLIRHDNLRYEINPVPEPSTWALTALALGGLMIRSLRARRT